jgi:hypothetical protein
LTTEQCEVLQAVYDMYKANPATWTRGGSSRDAHGNPCLPLEEDAVAWGIPGALQKVCDDYDRPMHLGLYEILKPFAGAITVNDTIGYERVLTILERYLETLQ